MRFNPSSFRSYSKTFYPQSNTTKYLNGIASSAHQRIYSSKKESGNRLITFFTKEFPLEFHKHQKQLLLSFLIFLGFTIIGAFSAASDSAFVRSILGDAYVNMTLENIANNDPMAVYKKIAETDMFLGITINNIRVSLMAFSLGVLAGIGTVFMLMQNAIDVQLYRDTPLHRANFIMLVKNDYFNETFFHRVAPGFVVQGGNADNRSTSSMRGDVGNYLIPSEFDAGHKHTYGAFSAAKYSEQNVSKASSPFEFFIVMDKGGTPHLNNDHTVFGRVISGMEVAEKIAQVETGNSEWPIDNVEMDIEILD